MKFLTIIGSYIKTHIITTAVVGTVVVGGAVATPIVINNVKENNSIVDQAQKTPDLTCAEGFELINGNCTEIETEQELEEPNEDEKSNNENTININTPTSTNKPSNDKTNQNNTTKPQENKPQESKPQETKPACNDISCKITESNRIVYYDGKMLFGIKVYQPYGYDVDGWQYNKSLIQSLSKEDRNYIFNNYFKKETYCNTNPRTPVNCLRYSAFEERLEAGIIDGSESEVNSSNKAIKQLYTPCIAYIQNGTIPAGYNKDIMDGNCQQDTTEERKWTVEDVQYHINRSNELIKFHTNVINETKGYVQAYQTTRSLLQQ